MKGLLASNRTRGVRFVRGFTLTEMLVTMLILALASTLMATGIPVAIDTYHRTVNSANAQVALSTTATVLRAELGTASRVIDDSEGTGKVFYKGGDGLWASIENDSDVSQGLVKQYYAGSLGINGGSSNLTPFVSDVSPSPLLSNEAITAGLTVTYDNVERKDGFVRFTGLKVKDVQGHTLAALDEYNVMTRFAE